MTERKEGIPLGFMSLSPETFPVATPLSIPHGEAGQTSKGRHGGRNHWGDPLGVTRVGSEKGQGMAARRETTYDLILLSTCESLGKSPSLSVPQSSVCKN